MEVSLKEFTDRLAECIAAIKNFSQSLIALDLKLEKIDKKLEKYDETNVIYRVGVAEGNIKNLHKLIVDANLGQVNNEITRLKKFKHDAAGVISSMSHIHDDIKLLLAFQRQTEERHQAEDLLSDNRKKIFGLITNMGVWKLGGLILMVGTIIGSSAGFFAYEKGYHKVAPEQKQLINEKEKYINYLESQVKKL